MINRFLIAFLALCYSSMSLCPTAWCEETLKSSKTVEAPKLSRKMHFLKTGQLDTSAANYEKQQNFWGKGVPARVRFPVHLAMWEESRRKIRVTKDIIASKLRDLSIIARLFYSVVTSYETYRKTRLRKMEQLRNTYTESSSASSRVETDLIEPSKRRQVK